jgi:parvulin-like peptidyl-prolyl isomerase
MGNNPSKKQPILTKKHQDRITRERRQTRLIVIGAILVTALVLLTIGYGILDQQFLKYRRPVAVVNGERISAEQFRGFTKYYRYNLIRSAEQTYQFASLFGGDQTMLQNFLGQLQSISAQLNPFNAGEAALNVLVDNTLMIQEAKKMGITVTDEEIEARMQEAMGYFANGTPTPTNTRPPIATSTLSPQQLGMLKPTDTPTPEITATVSGTLEAATATIEATETPEVTPTATSETPPTSTPTPLPTFTPTPYTFEGYQSVYATTVAGYTQEFEIPEEILRYVLEVDIYRSKLMKQVIGEVACEEEQVWAQHILVADVALAEVIRAKLEAGEDWYQLAAKYSQDESNKDQGGDLGWFGKGRMVPEFEQAAFGLSIGEVSQPVKTQFGWHIIRVLGHENRPLTQSECDQLADKKFSDWLKQLRENSEVELLSYWETVVPLLPTLPPEIQQVVQSAAQNAAQPGAIPTP